MSIEERVTASRLAQGLPARVEDPATLQRVAQLLASSDLILTSLQFTRDKFDAYDYPTHEFKQQRLADVDEAIAAVRSLRKANNNKGES